MTDRVGVALVGTGYWGPNLLRHLLASDDVDVHWVCDLSEDRARRAVGRYAQVEVTTSFDDVLADDRVDAVAIATPASTHATLALAAIDAGKHLLVEKPLASTLADGRRMAAAAAERGVVLMCDHVQCFSPAVQAMRDVVASGELGEIQYVDAVRINLGLIQPDVDVVWDLAPHDLSVFDYVLGDWFRPVAVSATGADPIGAGHACLAYLTMPMPGGAIAAAHVNWLSPTKMRRIIIGGSRRMLLWDDLSPTQRLQLFDRGVELSSDALAEAERTSTRISYRLGDMVAPGIVERDAIAGVVAELVDCVRTGREPVTGAASGLRVLTILEAAAASLAASGARIDLEAA
jgi:predicted dehydrogenase